MLLLRQLVNFVHWILVLTILLGSAACSANTATPGSPEPQPTATVNAAVELEDETATITFASYEYERGLYEPLMETFMGENPAITVQFVALPEFTSQDDAAAVNWLRMLATTADTAITWGPGMGAEAATYFRDLGPLLDMDPTFDPDDFWPGALDACADPEGRILGIPLGLSPSGIFFDKAAFNEAGLTHPAPGWTWQDFQKAAVALSRQKGDQTQYGFAEQAYIFGSILGPILSEQLNEAGGDLDAAALEKALQWYFDLANQKAIYPVREPEDWNKDWETWQAMFKSEARPAMWPGNLAESLPGAEWVYSESDPFNMMAYKTEGFAPYPIDPDHPEVGTTPFSPMCASISAGSAHPRAAWAWLSFLTRQPLVRDETQAWERLRLPARRSVAEKAGFWKPLPEAVQAAVRFGVEHAWYGSPYMQEFSILQSAVTDALQDQGTFAAALKSAQAELAATPQPTPDTAEVVVATPQPPPPAEAMVIEYYDNGLNYQNREAFKALVEAFNQSHPDIFIKVTSDFMGGPDIQDWLAYFADKFDCYTWYAQSFMEVKPEAVISLNALLEAEGPEFIQDFPADLLDDYRFEGELYGLPLVSQPQILAYNAELLEKRGLEPPGIDLTFDDFIELISKAASTSASSPTYGFLSSAWETWLLTGNGARWADLTQDPPRALFDTPEMIAALTWLSDLVKTNTLLIQTDDNWATIEEAVRTGQVAFWTSQAGTPEAWYFQMGKPEFTIGVAPMPMIETLDETDTIYWSSTLGQFISSQAEHPQACWTWIKYLSEQPGSFPGIPLRKSVMESEAWKSQVGAEAARVYQAALQRVQRPSDTTVFSRTGWPFYTWRSQAIEAVLSGEDPQTALQAAQRKAEEYLACIAGVNLNELDDEALQKEVYACARQVDPEGSWPTQ
jgi:ABC-type glycerol-3-phosphate transport system substrate-binding protein